MTTLNLPSSPEAEAAEPPDVIVRRLVRSLDYAKGFWLGFVRCNLPAQRRKAAAVCKELLEALGIHLLEVELTEPISELLPILKEHIASEQMGANENKIAIFVYGLKYSIPSSEAYPPILSYLNLNRELFRQELPHPLAIWLPEYALKALARRAPDFWAWRSGLYEFAPDADLAMGALNPIAREEIYVKSSLSGQVKRERLVMLKGLLEDYCELGNGPHEREVQGSILFEIANVYDDLGELEEAKQAFKKSLAIAREQDDKERVAKITHNLGGIELDTDDHEEARRLYEESLEIDRELGNKSGIAITLHELGRLSQDIGDFEEARRLYEESLEITHGLGNKLSEAISVEQLSFLDEVEGNFKAAIEHAKEAQEIFLQLGNREYIARIKKQISELEQKAELR